jgi:asparaginyl-tRNA synthetase
VQDEDFVRVTAPIITSSDCEGAGEVFRIVADADAADAEPQRDASTASADAASAAPHAKPGFWSGLPAYLTVSAQLHLEALAHGLARVWTTGPSFRAEGSATNRHLAEFWMCEAEMGTSGGAGALDEVMTAAEGCIRAAMRSVLGEGAPSPRTERAQADARFLVGDEDMLAVLRDIASSAEPWERITYDEAMRRLMTRHMTAAFAVPPCWGDQLASEHERWLAVGGPLFVTDYPATGKPFYMRVNEAEQGTARQTVACFDLLVPRIGELVGGSLREERADVLQARMRELGVAEGPLRWYVHDLRRFGCAPHGGFGLGVERLLSWVTETENLRDCVTFPRTKGPVRF